MTPPLIWICQQSPLTSRGGIAPGSHVNVTYIGDLETTSLEEVRIIAVTGEDPDTINDKHISFTVTGTIIGSTANTITVQTDDGAIDTFRTENAQDLTAGGMEYGDYVCLPSIHPNQNLLIFIQQLRYRMRKLLLFTPFSAIRLAMQEI